MSGPDPAAAEEITAPLPGIEPQPGPVDTPPKKRKVDNRGPRSHKAGAGKTTRPGAGRPPAKPRLAPKIQELLGTIGSGMIVAGQVRKNPNIEYDGRIILGGAERLAYSLEAVAKDNPSIQRSLELMVSSSAWGELFAAVAGMLVPIAASHGILPTPAAGFVGAEIPPPPPVKIPDPAAKPRGSRTTRPDDTAPPPVAGFERVPPPGPPVVADSPAPFPFERVAP